MTNFNNPAVLVADLMAVVKFSHAVDGIYIWEFFTNLDYEWSIIQGRRPYRWTIWIYSAARLATLIAVIIDLVVMSLTVPTDCQAWTSVSFVFSYMTFSLASLLIVLRTIAVWQKNKLAIGLAIGVWLINASFLLEGISKLRSEWSSVQSGCTLPNIDSNKLAISAMLGTDISLLLIMLAGLLRLRKRGGSKFELGRLLWKQGLIYLVVATTAEVVPVVFLSLDLNVAFNLMFIVPSVVTMSIAATRMYRTLADFGFSLESSLAKGSSSKGSGSAQRIFRSAPSAEDIPVVPISPNELQVAVHTSSERWQCQNSRKDAYVSFINIDGEVSDKSPGPTRSFDEDLESNEEK
ncbi:hypothetical protein BC827DRAFT_1186849 [Russula dissimulans]|nr:hypothetical protein BC827DRAFT_1186849 [Russula dissimulans]